MSTDAIYNFIRVNERILTGGQPTAEQLRAAAEEGIQAVINLATYNPEHSLENEQGLVQSLGMAYYPIPVIWDQPKEADFEAFEAALDALGDQKVLIHCAANYRVTAFYSLYALKNLGWSQEQASQFRAAIWQGSDVPVWERFIGILETRITLDHS